MNKFLIGVQGFNHQDIEQISYKVNSFLDEFGIGIDTFSFGEYIMSKVWELCPILRDKNYYDPWLKTHNILVKSLEFTTEAPTLSTKDILNGVPVLDDTILSINSYIRYFGNYIIPKFFGDSYWIKCIDKDLNSGYKVVWDAENDLEISYISKNGIMLPPMSLEQTIDKLVEIAMYLRISPLQGQDLIDFINSKTCSNS